MPPNYSAANKVAAWHGVSLPEGVEDSLDALHAI
jgi:hypothetical protein